MISTALDPKYQGKPFPVVALYPKEGTYWSDHPYAVLDLPTVTPEVRDAAARFRGFLLSAERQRAALERFGFRPADPQIALGPPIDAAHGVDPSQPKNVLPNPPVAVTRKILDTFEGVKRPVSITFVLDTSGSMSGAPLQQAKAGARVFLEALPAGDVVRLLLFSGKPRWIAERPEPLAKSRASLTASVESSFADGGTALYDAIVAAYRPAAGEPKGAARAVIVLTDGQDTDSVLKIEELMDQLRRQASGEGTDASAPRLFTIAYGDKADAGVLKQLAEAGGGGFFSGTPKDIQAVYAELATFF